MIAVLVIFLLFLSIMSTIVLRGYILSLFLLLIASNCSASGLSVVLALGFTLLFQCVFMDIFKKSKMFWLIAILFITYHAAIFVFQPYKINFSYFISYINAFIMFLLTLSINWNKEKLTRFTIAYISVLILSGLLEFLFVNPVRVAGLLAFATLYAVVLVTVWTIWLTETILKYGYSKKVIMVTIFVLLAVLLSGARMGLIGIALGLFLSGISKNLIVNINKPVITKVTSGIALLICLFVVITVVWKFIPNDMFIKKTFQSLLSMKLDSSNLGRVIAWIAAIEIIPKHIIWGVGPYNFDMYLSRMASAYDLKPVYYSLQHAHNLFLIVLTELGISGFIVIGSCVFLCVFKLFHYILKGTKNSSVYAVANGFIVMMLLGMFDGTPLTLGTLCFGGWLMGISLHFSLTHEPEENQNVAK
jgi:O-antigen ligase